MTPEWLVGAMVMLVLLAAGFCAGAAWAAYRAVGWADRCRAWAHSVVIDERVST